MPSRKNARRNARTKKSKNSKPSTAQLPLAVSVASGKIPKPFGNVRPSRIRAYLRQFVPIAITTGQQGLSGHVVCINILATANPSSEVQNINYSTAASLQQIDYNDLYEEWRILRVHFRIIYPGEQDTPLNSVEIAGLANYSFSTAATPNTMLMSNLDDYCVMPIPTSHMVEGSYNLSSIMRSRGAVWSKVGSNTYYGKFSTGDTPLLLIRTNFFGTTLVGQQYAQIFLQWDVEYQGIKATLE